MDLEEAGSGGGGLLSFRNHLSNLGLLLGGELGAASPDAALLTGGIDSGLSAFPQHGALELRPGPHHLHHHPAGRSGRVDGLGQTPESRSGYPELLHDREHVAQRARQPIQLPDNDNVTGTKLIEEPEELGPVPMSTGSLLAKDVFAPSRFERRHLSSGVLIGGGNAGVTDQHCIMVLQNILVLQYHYATPKRLKTRPGPDRCKTVPLCNRPVVDSLPAVPLFPSLWMIPDRSSPSRVRFAPWTTCGADPKEIAVYEGKGGVGPGLPGRKESFGHTSALSRSGGAESPVGP